MPKDKIVSIRDYFRETGNDKALRIAAQYAARRPLTVPKRKPTDATRWDDPSPAGSPAGVANPYGVGLAAYEPATEVLHDPGVDDPMLAGWDDAYNAVQQSRAEDSRPTAIDSPVDLTAALPPAPTGSAHAIGQLHAAGAGSVAAIVDAAKTMLGKPYVWGGTTSRGTDCSGLIYYAFNAAGIKMPRYRAVDYRRLGIPIADGQARAGDLVTWDNPGDTDHVGIYLGNGLVIQSPQSGDVTKISKVWGNAEYRRVLQDDAFGQVATPAGGQVAGYFGRPADAYFAPVSLLSPVSLRR